MTVEDCYGNWNFMHEFRIGNNWHPCNIIEVLDNTSIKIYTRNGSIIRELHENVRQMTEKQYLKYRTQIIDIEGKYAYKHGYHKNVEDDIKLLHNSIAI